MRYVLGIDNGGSNVKCALFDMTGEELASAGTVLKTSQPHPGFVERDPQALWEQNCGIIRRVIDLAGISAADIAAVSVCGYGGGLCLCDSAGQSVRPLIASTDTRAQSYVDALDASGAANGIFRISHQQPWSGQAAPLLLWLREHEPQTLDSAAYALSVKDYVRYRLTGEFYSELTDSSNYNITDPETRALCPALFSLGGIDDERRLFRFPLLRPQDIAGYVTAEAAMQTGLREGIPVAAGLYDVSACTLGCGCLGCGSLAVTIGTWAMASYFGQDFDMADASTIVTAAPMDGRFLLEQGSATGTANLNWLLDRVISPMYPNSSRSDLYDLCSKVIISKSPAERDLVFVPHLYSNPSGKNAGAAFLNLRPEHNIDDILYSVLEGIVLSACRHIRILCRDIAGFDRIALAGGVASSTEWSQMFCDMLGLPVDIMAGEQQGARGAAMCAGIACGEFSGYDQAVEAMSRKHTTLYPDKSRQGAEKIARYEEIHLGLEKLY